MISLPLRSGIRGIVLDAVGTLIEPEPPVAIAYAAVARRQGVELKPALVQSRFAQHFGQDEIDEARGPLATNEAVEVRRWRRIVAGVLPEVPDRERAFQELWHHFGQASSWRPFPEVAPAVRSLAGAGYRICVASNFDSRLRYVLAGMPGLAGLAETVVISSEVGWRKPHAEFYRTACRALGLAPAGVLMVGDDPENDFHGPRRAGMEAILVDRLARGGGDPPSVPDLGELAEWLTGPGLVNPPARGR